MEMNYDTEPVFWGDY